MSEKVKELKGTIKWFNNEKGYGYLVVEDHGDVMVHKKIMQRDWHISFIPKVGDWMKVRAEQTSKGWRAVEILSHNVSGLRRKETANAGA